MKQLGTEIEKYSDDNRKAVEVQSTLAFLNPRQHSKAHSMCFNVISATEYYRNDNSNSDLSTVCL